MASHGLPTLCDGPEKPTQWKSESVTAQPTYGLSRVGSRDAYTSKKTKRQKGNGDLWAS